MVSRFGKLDYLWLRLLVSQSGRLTTQSGVKMFQWKQFERLSVLMLSQSETCL